MKVPFTWLIDARESKSDLNQSLVLLVANLVQLF